MTGLNPKKSNLRRIHYYLALGVGLSVLYLIGIWWGLPTEFTASVDAPVPLGVILYFSQYTDPAQAAKYPAVHYFVQAPFYALVLLANALSGQFDIQAISTQWPYGLTDPVSTFTHLILVSSVISTCMAVALIVSLWSITLEGTTRLSRIAAIGLLAISGVFTFYARVGNYDIPYLFWLTLSLGFLWRYVFRLDQAVRNLLTSGVFAALSIGTKDQAAGIVAGLALVILTVNPASAMGWRVRLVNATRFLGVLTLTYGICAILPQPARWIHHLSLWTLSSPGVTDFIQVDNTFSGQITLLGSMLNQLANVLSPIGLIFALVGAVYLVSRRQYRVVAFSLIPIASYYLIIIFNIRFSYERFMLPVAVMLIPAIGFGIHYLIAGRRLRVIRLAGMSVIALALGYQFLAGYVPITYVQALNTKAELARTIAAYVPSGSSIIWLGRITEIPNAEVYTDYQLRFPDPPPPGYNEKMMRHAIKLYSPDAEYILSTRPLDASVPDQELLARWTYPEWIKSRVFVAAVMEYYLYRRSP